MTQKTEEFTGRTSEVRDSPWLASEDILGLGEVVVEIEKVWRHHNVVFEEGRVEAEILAIQFVGKKKQLVLNNKNRKTIAHLLRTGDTQKWRGERVTLYVDHDVLLFGKKTCGIRIRPTKPKPKEKS